jgi:hypothetical protein
MFVLTAREEHPQSNVIRLQQIQMQSRQNPNLQLTFRQLKSRLQRAKTRSRQNSRKGAVAALEAFLHLIGSIPKLDNEHLQTPIWPLMMALKDLEKGRIAPMLRPSPGVRHRAAESWMRKLIKSFVVLYIEALYKAGMSLEEASRFVAKLLESRSFRVGGRLETQAWKTVSGWRDRIPKLARSDPMRKQIDDLRPQVPWQSLKSPKQAQSYVSKNFRKLMDGLGRAALE